MDWDFQGQIGQSASMLYEMTMITCTLSWSYKYIMSTPVPLECVRIFRPNCEIELGQVAVWLANFSEIT